MLPLIGFFQGGIKTKQENKKSILNPILDVKDLYLNDVIKSFKRDKIAVKPFYDFYVIEAKINTKIKYSPLSQLAALDDFSFDGKICGMLRISEFSKCKPNEKCEKITNLLEYYDYLGLRDIFIEILCDEISVDLARVVDVFLHKSRANIHVIITGTEYHWPVWHQFRSMITPTDKLMFAPTIQKGLSEDEMVSSWSSSLWKGELIEYVFIHLINTVDTFCDAFCIFKSFGEASKIVIKTSTSKSLTHEEFCTFLREKLSLRQPAQKRMITNGNSLLTGEPLQPLRDNLGSSCYKAFERDEVKYMRYEKAVREYFKTVKNNEIILVLVVGAGHGALVETVLKMAEACKRKVKVYALEKNPYCIPHLERRQWSLGDYGEVKIVESDIREWDTNVRVDLVISELIGSFSDNELSPECLDVARRYTKEKAVSIPRAYSSFIEPIMDHRFYLSLAMKSGNPYETLWVMPLNHCYYATLDQKQLFSFSHYKLSTEVDFITNDREKEVEFTSQDDFVLHGFAGYFDCILFDDVKISTCLGEATEGIITWEPMFIPLCEPVNIKHLDVIRVKFWRRSDKTRVWYEWCLTRPICTRIHNLNGKFYSISTL